MSWGVTAYWLNEERYPAPPPAFLDIDEFWWQSVSHWGPVLRTHILVADD